MNNGFMQWHAFIEKHIVMRNQQFAVPGSNANKVINPMMAEILNITEVTQILTTPLIRANGKLANMTAETVTFFLFVNHMMEP